MTHTTTRRWELTDRQDQCMSLLAEGLSRAAIARHLGIHRCQVTRHIQRARRVLAGQGPGATIVTDPEDLDNLDPRRIVAVV